MRSLPVVQVSAMLLAACTPWLVASIALRVATAQAGLGALHVHSMKLLRTMTPAVAIAAAIATVLLPPSPWLLIVAALGFGAPAIVGLKVLGEIDDVTKPARQVNIAERAASLRPRRAGEYLPWSWRLAACGATVLGVAAFIVRASGSSGRRMLVPIAFAAAALIFLWLYEVWTHQVITGPIVAGDARDLRRIVRRIFGMELLLVVVCLGAAHALVDLDVATNGTFRAAISVGASVVAVVGCALALSSGLMGRRYDTV